MKSPLTWPGGKGMLVSKLLPLVPYDTIYVEPFSGGASMLFARERSPIEVLNDIDKEVVSFFRVFREPVKLGLLCAKLMYTPYSREEWREARETWPNDTDEVERAYHWFVTNRQSFGGGGGSWSFSRTKVRRGMAQVTSRWLSALENLPATATRLVGVQLECDDWLKVCRGYDSEHTVFYGDPPYPLDSVADPKIYKHAMSDQDHQRLIEWCLTAKGSIVLSSYPNPIYERLIQVGWERIDIATSSMMVGRTRGTGVLGEGSATKKAPRTEIIWRNQKAQQKTKEAVSDQK